MSSDPNASSSARIAPSTFVRHVGHAADRAITQFADRGIECFGVNIAKQHACARLDERVAIAFADPRGTPITTAPLPFNSSCIFKYL